MRDPITNYKLGVIRQQERQAEFEQYWRYSVDRASTRKSSKRQPLLVGVGSIVLTIFVIAQTFIR